MQPEPDFDALAKAIDPDATVIQSWVLAGGISASMWGLSLSKGANRQQKSKYVVRAQPNKPHRGKMALRQEFQLLKIAAAQSDLPAPEPVMLDAAGEIGRFPTLVLHFVEGESSFKRDRLETRLRALARTLARIHQIDGERVDFLPKSGQSCLELKNLGRERGTDQALFADVKQKIAQRLVENRNRESVNRPTLLHGDFWPGNLLWQAGRDVIAAVIDWEDASVGDPLIDLAKARQEISWIYGEQAFVDFTTFYLEENRIDTGQLPYWDLCAGLRFMRLANNDLEGLAAYFHPYGRTDITAISVRRDFDTFWQQAVAKFE